MNLCFICREYPPAPRTGGIGSATRDTARALVRLGHRVHVVAPAWDGEPVTADDGRLFVHRARVARVQAFTRVAGHTLDRLAWSWAAARTVARLHRAEGLDVVEAPEFAAEGFVAVRRAALPVVVRLHTPLALVRALNGAPLTADCRRTVGLERAAIAAAAAVTAPSGALARACAKAGYSPRVAGARVIPCGVDTRIFCPDGDAPARDGSPLVLFPGRLETRKGVGDLADALPLIVARVPEARFAFVGADTATAPGGASWLGVLRARARVAGIEDRVRFTGFVSREQMPRWYRAASVVVAPSPFEPFGIVYLEAMACGRPVVGCAAGAFPEIVTDGREGRAVPPRDPGALAAAVVEILEDPAAAAAMGKRARARVVEEFSIERVAARTADVYGEVAGGGRRAA